MIGNILLFFVIITLMVTTGYLIIFGDE